MGLLADCTWLRREPLNSRLYRCVCASTERIQARRKAGRINSALQLHPARHHAQGSQRAARSEFLSPHLPGSLEASPTAGLWSGEGLAVGMVWSCVRRGLFPMHTARREIRSPFLLPERDGSTGLEGENRSPGPFPEPPAFPQPGAASRGSRPLGDALCRHSRRSRVAPRPPFLCPHLRKERSHQRPQARRMWFAQPPAQPLGWFLKLCGGVRDKTKSFCFTLLS